MRQDIKELIRMVISHFMIITTVLLTMMGLVPIFMQEFEASWPWYFPFQIIGVAAPTALCSLIYYNKKELTKKQFLVRCAIHFTLLIGIVLGEGYLFKWWSEPSGILIVLGVFIGVYAIVWISTIIKDKQSSDKINKALKNVNKTKDEE